LGASELWIAATELGPLNKKVKDIKIQNGSIDGFVKSPFSPILVIPAKAGIHLIKVVLDSCFRRSDGFPDFLRDHQH